MSEETKETAVEETKTPEAVQVNLPAFYGQKAGMTRVFNENGGHEPVTVIKLIPNVVTQVKTADKDGYEAYQVSYYEKNEKNLTSPRKGHLKKSSTDKNLSKSSEVRVSAPNADFLGKEVTFENFQKGAYVDVTSTSKGKGFQGVMKRYNFSGGPAAHGSKFHRTPGSIGNCASPGRVVKGKKLPGRMGNKTTTVQNLKVVEVNTEKGYMLVKGSVPGSKSGLVKLSQSVKK